MTSVIEKLKAVSVTLRKARNEIAPTIVFVLSEIEKVGKNDGNRETTEDEAIKVIQKTIATIDENLKLDLDDRRRSTFNYEKAILVRILPKMATDDEITTFLRSMFAETSYEKSKKGEIMKALREQFGSLIDMKRAGVLVSELYGV
jgi:uncharacterized protein